MTKLVESREMIRLQEVLDYWLEEGGNLAELHYAAEEARQDLVAKLSKRALDLVWIQGVYLADMEVYTEGIQMICKIKEQEAAEYSFDFLLRDYGLTAGHCVLSGEPTMSPMDYLDAFMESTGQPSKAVCEEFLLQYYTEESIEDWIDGIAWDGEFDRKRVEGDIMELVGMGEKETPKLQEDEFEVMLEALIHYEEGGYASEALDRAVKKVSEWREASKE